MRRTAILLLVIAAVAATAAIVYVASRSQAAEARPRPARGSADAGSAAAGALAPALDSFGLELLRRQAAISTEGDVVVSPASLYAVLAMALNGAAGETAQEMRAVLGVADQTHDVNQGWADLIWLAQAGDEPEVSIADSLWLRDGVAFRQAFLDLNRDYYDAETRELPTDAGEAAGEVNEWVERQTAGRITDMVQPGVFNGRTILALFNTIHLKVKWEHFDDGATIMEPFTLASGERVDVPTMHTREVKTPYVEGDRFEAVALATGGPVTVWIVVPREGLSAEALLDRLDSQRLEAAYREARDASGSLALPRFTTTYQAADLVGTLAAMGMPRAFSPAEAEFPGIADVGAQRIFISEVVQKTFVALNEHGVEAAAASGATMEVTGVPLNDFEIRADRPFLFVLTEKSTSAPLFMGLVRDPR